jgi:glycosyltransferase involved in cell wall biosynthesis
VQSHPLEQAISPNFCNAPFWIRIGLPCSYDAMNVPKIVAINVLNSNSGGGKNIRDAFLKLLNDEPSDNRYVVFAAEDAELGFLSSAHIVVKRFPRLLAKGELAPLVYRFLLGRAIAEAGAEVLVNFGDLIVRTPARQIYLFDWPYALEVHPKVWAKMTVRDRFVRKLKLFLLKRDLWRPDIVLAQTVSIAEQLRAVYRLLDVRVLPNAVLMPDTSVAAFPYSPRSDQLKMFVCPAVYYPHKNLEVLLDVADIIIKQKKSFRIVVTVEPNTAASDRFIKKIHRRGLQDVVQNVGQVSAARIAQLYLEADAVLLPTLLESFSIVYVEAMYYRVPILTSDMWFAHSVCGTAAKYFDPFSPEDIFASMVELVDDPSCAVRLAGAGLRKLQEFPSWEQNFRQYQSLIDELFGAVSLLGGANGRTAAGGSQH